MCGGGGGGGEWVCVCVCVPLHTHKFGCLTAASTPFPRPIFSQKTHPTPLLPSLKGGWEKSNRSATLFVLPGLRGIIFNTLRKTKEKRQVRKNALAHKQGSRIAAGLFPSAFLCEGR